MSAHHDLAGNHYQDRGIPAALAGDATAKVAVFNAPDKARVTAIHYVPVSAVTGANTNSRTLTVRKADGTVIGTIAFLSGTNAAALARTAFTLSATAADLLLNEGDVLYVESALVGTGLALPISTIRVTTVTR